MWYEGTSHRYTSGIKVKVVCKGQGQISGSCFSKDGCFGGISVSHTHLVSNVILPYLDYGQSKQKTQVKMLTQFSIFRLMPFSRNLT